MILKQRFTHDDHPTQAAHAFDQERIVTSTHGAAKASVWTSGALAAPATGTPFVRTGSLLLVAGSVAYVVHIVVRSLLTAGADPVEAAQSNLWVPVNALGALGAALVLLGLPAIFGGIGRPAGRASLIGFALLEVSWLFFGLFLSLYGALVLPWLADEAPRLVDSSSSTPLGIVAAFAIGALAWLVGAVLLAIPLVNGPVHTRWVGYILPASALWALAGSLVIAPDGPASNLAVNLLSNLGPVLLLIGLSYLGLQVPADRTTTGHLGTDKRG